MPVFWSVLDKAGNSHTAERIALLKRFIAVFGVNNIAALLADREFVGEEWFAWLQAQAIPFHQRLKRNTRIPNAWNQLKRADQLFGSLKPGQLHHLPSRRPVWGCFVALSALRLNDGDWLIIASSDTPQTQAIETYARRWEIETLFGCLKSRGFNFEDTHLVDPERLSKLFALLALAFAWTYHSGEQLDSHQPILFKKPFSGLSSLSSDTGSTLSAVVF
ncbi:IS4 family transposase [Methylobacter sp.]|uniref:IS4 family transposase n=1 Tax=Methylobacter sp. TaxID=2051955 RepID=UPI003DA39459